MKRFYVAILICSLALSVGVTALAQGKAGAKDSNKSAGCCAGKGEATDQQLKKFKADTIDLRQEMMNKKFELQRENLKEIPDSARVDALKSELAAIKARIETVRVSSKLPESVCNRVCRMMDEEGSKCHQTGSCGCKDCQQGKSCADCSNCKDGNGKECTGKDCKNGAKAAGCKDCGKKAKAVKAGCKSCNSKK